MSVVQRFCARESAALGDPLAGSAAHAERNLLLSWPRAKWRRSLRQASDMPEAVNARLEAIAESGRRVNLIHRRDQSPECHRLYLMPENRRYEVPRDALPAFLAALQEDESLARWEIAPPQGPLLLCCTHGKKDKCCAKFGYATYRALAAAVADRGLPFEVWESTHLGGCRLAASAVVFPALRKYGRISDEHVVPLLESEAANHPYLPCYRGDSRLSPLQQCAQVAALEWLAGRDLRPEVRVAEDATAETADRRRLSVHWRDGEQTGRLAVTCEARTLRRHDTCADIASGPPTPSRVWVATALEAVATQY
ncbi:sucrase ferredoxin [Halomonas heilongjiangensis]|uniref:Sucrase ferredoxin n=1 Tax=Halomonas heilongjiangensis TaxID=1387883 RepID=A0A2N7THB5_9GAMM|nr:sucrase ferredoxin [Halomonas heilongjiangensis]PMR67585.1 sucrase ferredoxin [Halomonas heilongjiangensis]PXX86778.1 sucrase ferredoxin [Halomonas heilongjiangensis]